MGYQSVFRSLLELFPQVDIRVLKAVAIEHCMDIEAAVEFIVLEVLPSIEKIQEPFRNIPEVSSYVGVKRQELSCSSKQQDAGFVAESQEDPCLEHISKAYEDSSDNNESLYSTSESHGSSDDQVDLCLDTKTDGLASSLKHQEVSSLVDSHQCQSSEPISITCDHAAVTSHCNDDLSSKTHGSNGSVADLVFSVRGKDQDLLNWDTVSSKVENVSVTVHDLLLDEGLPHIIESEALAKNDIDIHGCEVREILSESLLRNNTEKLSFDFESSPEKLGSSSDSTTIVTCSGQICRMDFLEDFIGEAKKNKKTLLLAMETVCRLTKEAEVCEEAAEHAKLEAARGGLDILAKVDDLTKLLSCAKEANSMHAGEIYGERAILATEARELQSRLLNLSEERDRSLSIIDKMRESLEERIATAKAEIAAAEKEKLEKEKSSREALSVQELVMENVVEESKKLLQEADENSRLREFLVDRGRMVDSLQGEIAVICEDVKLLKDKFDRRLTAKENSPNESIISALSSPTSTIKSRASGKDFDLVEYFESAKMAGDEMADNDWFKTAGSNSPIGKAAGDVGKVSSFEEEGWEQLGGELSS